MEQSLFIEAVSRLAGREIPRILWNLKVHYRIHRGTPLDPFVSKMNPVHTLTSYFFKINFNIILSFMLRSPKWSLPFKFFCMYFSPRPRVTFC
jgi:hypothetical protein